MNFACSKIKINYMKLRKIVALFSLLIFTCFSISAQTFTIEMSKKINPIAFIKTEKAFLLVSDTAIFSFDKKAWKPIKLFYKKINTAAFVDNKVWLGGFNKLFYLDEKTNDLVFWKGLNDGNIDVLSLQTNIKTQELLVASADDGAFSFKNDVISNNYVSHIRAEDVCACGGYTWVGTNTGLVRLDKKGKIQVYAEEGVGGFEIPDNLVSRLECIDGQHLLVIMPEALAFLDADEKNTSSHAEGFEFLGKKGNLIFDAVRTSDGDLLFLTEDGLIYMNRKEISEHHEHGASIEVYSNAGKPAISKIKNPLLGESVWEKGYFDDKGNLWLASALHVLKVSKNEWKKMLK